MQDEKLSSADGFGNAPKSKGLSQRCLVQTLTHKRTYVPNLRKLCIIYSCTYVYSYILRQLMLVWCCLLTTGSAVHCCGGRSTGCLACRVWSTSGSCTVLSS